jgi:hypothetical protein
VLYPAFWGIAQLGTGALSDRIGRKWLISTGMLVQAGALALGGKSTSYGPWIVAVVLLGARDRVALRNPAGCDGRRRPPDLVARAVVSTGRGAMPGSPPARCWRV